MVEGGHVLKARLMMVLRSLKGDEHDYDRRYGLILDAMWLADRIGFRTGYRLDPTEPEWPVAYIELPSGQISWHMPQFPEEWDGHTTSEKNARIDRWIAAAQQ